MIIYSNTLEGFGNDVDNNVIVEKIQDPYIKQLGRRPGDPEVRSWNNSMQFMERLVRTAKLPKDCGVLIEFTLPYNSKRIDFIVTGHNVNDHENFVIFELKQWEKAEVSDKQDLVRTYTGGGMRDVAHPSYQANSYERYLVNMNEAIQSHNILCRSCAYLHNYTRHDPEPLLLPQYESWYNESPLYFKDDVEILREFLRENVGKGKGMETLYSIENGRIRPSKKLIDCVIGLFEGNEEFILLDEQKVAYSTILSIAEKGKGRHTIIVKGGPGTGKSVLSMNALGSLIKAKMNVRFVAPNASFRSVILDKLTKDAKKKADVLGLFSGSASFFDKKEETYDALIVDEAHRLKNGTAYQYKGDNQVYDIIKTSRLNVFFIDDSQRIRPEDIGSVSEIKRVADYFKSEVHEIELEAQFRCAGAVGFINWLDTVLQIRETGNFMGWDKDAFDFQLFDSPNEVLAKIREKNAEGRDARMLAGYAWHWTSEKEGNKNGEMDDVTISECEFSMPWNSRSFSTKWAIEEKGVDQIGCIHTSQGLEFDYVGVVIGNDLKFDPKRYEVYADYNEYYDSAGKKGLKNDPEVLTRLVTNVYKVLMSRGMKGCYVYCRDPEFAKYLKERLARAE